MLEDPPGFLDGGLEVGRGLPKEELLDRWQSGFATLLDALAVLPEGSRVPWYGPPMSPLSAATARLMEYWAHGQDVVDALGVRRTPTERLKHTARLAFRTRGSPSVVRGWGVPAGGARWRSEVVISCRPCERRDPSPLASQVKEGLSHTAETRRHGVWVPAFAGTTACYGATATTASQT